MRRSLTTVVIAAAAFGPAGVAAIAATGEPGGTAAPAAFRLADGSAGCNFRAGGEIACRAAGFATAVVLAPDGSSRMSAEEAVAWDDATPVLLAAESWWGGNVSCRVSGPRVLCSAGGGTIAVGG